MHDTMYTQASATVRKAPVPRKWPSGKQSVEMTCAIVRRWQVGGEWSSATTWILVDAWGNLAGRMLGNGAPEIGDRIFIAGQQQVEEYEDDKGKPGIRLRITASVIEILTSRAAATALAELRAAHDDAVAECARLRALLHPPATDPAAAPTTSDGVPS